MNDELNQQPGIESNSQAKTELPSIPSAPPSLNIPQPLTQTQNNIPPLVSPTVGSPVPPALNSITDQNNQNPFQSKNKNRRWLIGGAIALIIALGVGLAFWYSNSKKAHLVIEYSDINSISISLNGSTVKGSLNDQSIQINTFPGRYRLVINKSEYSPFTQDIDLTQGKTLTIRPGFALFPKSLNTTSDQTSSIDFARLSLDGNTVFFLGYNRQIIYRMDIKSRIATALTSNKNKLVNVKDIQWSGNPDLAIVKTADGTYFYEIPTYDFVNQVYLKKAGNEVISPIWDPTNSNRIAFVYAPSTGEYSLVFTDKYFSSLDRKPVDISAIKNPKLVWSPDSNYIALLDQETDKNKNNIWLYKTADASLTQVTQLGGVTDLSFSPDSTGLIYESFGANNNNRINAYSITNKKLIGLNLGAKVAQAAWKEGSTFYIPDRDKNLLTLNDLTGKNTSLNYSFDNPTSVQGMFYSPNYKSLIFYTNKTIFTIDLSSE